MVRASESLADFPKQGRPIAESNLRELFVPGTPYLLVYRLSSDMVEIAQVWHVAQHRGPLDQAP
ncbi:MAG: type II toxin-antitoxin system RelE/ParE family toxin [Magnetovibrionaceae bacterium]